MAWEKTPGTFRFYDARGFVRGGEFCVRHDDGGAPASQPSMKDILHWEVTIGGESYPSSPSDMERLVTGKMSVETFIQ